MRPAHAPAARPRGTRPSRPFPDPLPGDPVALLSRWLEEAAKAVEGDFNAMVLATATPEGAPSARVVLCKQIEAAPAAIVFYTSYDSRKGRELEANPRAAGVFYWPSLRRQARVEGTVVRTTAKESPLSSRAALAARVVRTAVLPAAAARRPASWGGYRVLLDRVELWAAGAGRLHERVAWTALPASGAPVWTSTRLFP
jgi:pyridoxamine 5'-phosphate oxidase